MKKDLRSENVKKIAEDFPMCITEIKDKNGNLKKVIDFEKLKELLTGELRDREEAYEFTWAGKREALRKAFEYNDKILRPVVDDSLNFFDTQNIYIEGDNLDVLRILRRSYFEKIKMIYIDPPYNTGHDFIYNDNFKKSKEDEEEELGLWDEEDNMLFENKESNGRFHSDWCSMIYSRLLLARDLLRPDGVIFISIDDNEVASLRKICDEVFGEDNFVAEVIWERAYAPINLKKHFSTSHDYILAYAKNLETVVCNGIKRSKEADSRYSNPDNDPRGVWTSDNLSVGPAIEENIYPITTPSGRIVKPPAGRCWSLSKKTFFERLQDNRIWFGPDGNNVPRIKRFLSELKKQGITPMTIWKYTEVGHSQEATQSLANIFDGKKYFVYPKPVELIKRTIELYSSPPPPIGQKSSKQAQEGLYDEKNGIGGESNTSDGDIILDFFSGSATTAHAVMQLNAEDNGNRKYIMVQIPEKCDEKSEAYKAGYKNICEIGKERIRRAGKKIKEETNANIDYGFKVFKVDSSNFKEEISVPADEFDFKNLENCIENIKEDRTSLDLVYQCILSSRKELTLPIKIENIEGFTVYNVDNFSIMCCFDENISDEVMKYMADKEPEAVYFRDSCFRDSSHKLNVKEYFKVMSETTRFEDV